MTRWGAGEARTGRAAGSGPHGRRRAGGWGAQAQHAGTEARGSRRGGLAVRRRGHAGCCRARGLGMLLGQQAVHSVHSACFDPI